MRFPPVPGEKCEIWLLTENGYHRIIAHSHKEAQYIQSNLRDTKDESFGEW